jgi:DNA-directed RNA polymerase subunit RPC12/RpoP
MNFICEKCGVTIKASEEHVGKSATCPKCGQKTRLFQDTFDELLDVEPVPEPNTNEPPRPTVPDQPLAQRRSRNHPGEPDPLERAAADVHHIRRQLQGIGCMVLVITLITILSAALTVLSILTG